jgi:hypothetical protein
MGATHNSLMVDAKSPVADVMRHEIAIRRICLVLMGTGIVLLALGLYLGFVRHASPALVFGLLGGTTLVFALVLVVLRRPGAPAPKGSQHSTKQPSVPAVARSEPEIAPQPHAVVATQHPAFPAVDPVTAAKVLPVELAVDASSEAKAEPAAHLEAQVKAPPAADLASEVNVPPWPTTPIPLSPASVSEAKLNADLARLMNITLGDIFGLLQAALDKDPDKHPESREHVPGWTGTQAEARAPAVKTDEPAVQTSA